MTLQIQQESRNIRLKSTGLWKQGKLVFMPLYFHYPSEMDRRNFPTLSIILQFTCGIQNGHLLGQYEYHIFPGLVVCKLIPTIE